VCHGREDPLGDFKELTPSLRPGSLVTPKEQIFLLLKNYSSWRIEIFLFDKA
jgi:hypothetical protein